MGRKVKTSTAIDEELLVWIDKLIEAKRFANRTHSIECALQRLREKRERRVHIKENEA
ncbi:MAG: hypothetical protein QXF52_02540 [Thermoproteota archaeon]